VLQNQRVSSADNFETIRPRGFSGGTDEDSDCLIRPFEIRGDATLDFDLLKAAQLATAADARRPTEQPLQGVEVVEAWIEQNAAAPTLPGRPPRAAGEIRFSAKPIGGHPIYPDDFTEAAVDRKQKLRFRRGPIRAMSLSIAKSGRKAPLLGQLGNQELKTALGK